MYKLLKEVLWKKIDAVLADEFSLVAIKRMANWRVYATKRAVDGVFLTVRFFDVAGGGFSFSGGLSSGGWPSDSDEESKVFALPTPGGFSLVCSAAFGLPDACVDVELQWQTPSEDLIREAFSHPNAKELLDQLGVTMTERHHLLSYGILEAVGLNIPMSEFDGVVNNFEHGIRAVIDKSVRPMHSRFISEM